jgi:hypothetical protein
LEVRVVDLLEGGADMAERGVAVDVEPDQPDQERADAGLVRIQEIGVAPVEALVNVVAAERLPGRLPLDDALPGIVGQIIEVALRALGQLLKKLASRLTDGGGASPCFCT